jgi:hypothetical protein
VNYLDNGLIWILFLFESKWMIFGVSDNAALMPGPWMVSISAFLNELLINVVVASARNAIMAA